MEAFQKSLWSAVAASIALTAILGWIAARRGLAPVRALARLTHGISASRLGERLPPESVPTELVDLALAFNDMLFLAKVDNGLIVPSSEMVDLAAETRELFGFYEAFAEEHGVSLVLAGAGVVPGDRLMMRRALSNLLSNALRHTPCGGSVKVLIDQGESGETWLAENPGEEIESEHLPRLFGRFYRVDPFRQKASEGAGLGLAITKSIVEAHRGTIRISSANGSTRFAIMFPATGAGLRLCPSPARIVRRARLRSSRC